VLLAFLSIALVLQSSFTTLCFFVCTCIWSRDEPTEARGWTLDGAHRHRIGWRRDTQRKSSDPAARCAWY